MCVVCVCVWPASITRQGLMDASVLGWTWGGGGGVRGVHGSIEWPASGRWRGVGGLDFFLR